MRHGGQILVDQLALQGCDTVFCVPGESYLAVLDGLYGTSSIRTIVCRQEGGAAIMAEADGKLTGHPGVCFVTRGPGATNGSIGVHIARQDSTPMIYFVGLPSRQMEDREAFQEFDLKAVFGALAKWAAVIPDAARIPEYVSHAYHMAMSGRPGPVVLGLPEDMLGSSVDVDDARSARVGFAAPVAADMAVFRATLARAERPLLVIGGPGWSEETRARLETFVSAWDLPVAAAFRYQDYIDNRHENYVGHVGIGVDGALADAVRHADVLIALGPRLGEMTTSGYTLVTPPNPGQFLVHIHPDGDELGSVYRPDLPIVSSATAFLDAALQMELITEPPWSSRRAELRARFVAFRQPEETPGAVRMEDVVLTLDDLLPDTAIVTNGAGNYTAWVHRYHLYRAYRTQLAPTAGAMGYGVPAAVAAALRKPEAPVVAFAGDGCFLMNGQELATACQYGVRMLIIVVNNGMYGTIRMHQEKKYPRRVIGTSLTNPDFVQYARAFGADGEVLRATEDIRASLTRGLASDVPYLIEIQIDPQALTPKQTLDDLSAPA